ncbi:MAG TPA: branched-chain amino acid aminotransferase [bacterium]|nr:branched-chain amino acid aminotransferase [bacterium]
MFETYQETRMRGNGALASDVKLTRSKSSRLEHTDLVNPGFGVEFADHMLSMVYADGEWKSPEIIPFDTIELSPAMLTLHYGQAIFEGMKAFQSVDGSVNMFRPDAHHRRFVQSCRRICLPEIGFEEFMQGITTLIDVDRQWVPETRGNALYIRPFVFATDEMLSVKVSKTYRFLTITSPVGAYYKEGFNPVSLITSDEYVRAVRGGVGNIKAPGNYAASLLPAKQAEEQGYTQVLWLDAFEKKYVEEVGTMNIMFVIDDVLITPPLEGAILPGVTRDSALKIAKDWGKTVVERRISIDEVFESARDGSLQEVFGTGTAAVISPVGSIHHRGDTIAVNGEGIGPLAESLFKEITGIQYGEKEDRFGWIYSLS